MSRVLIVEDDEAIAVGMADTLRREGHAVSVAGTVSAACAALGASLPDLVILDLGLPDGDGFTVLAHLRRRDAGLPVLVLSARTMELDKVRALDGGADDYMTKPFGLSELLARIRALLRRSLAGGPVEDGRFRVGDLDVDPRRFQARRGGVAVPLTAREFRLLEYLHRNAGMVLSRGQILDAVWGLDCASGERTVDVHMAKLRRKVEADPDSPRHLLTVRSAGYKLEP